MMAPIDSAPSGRPDIVNAKLPLVSQAANSGRRKSVHLSSGKLLILISQVMLIATLLCAMGTFRAR
jgi:hypothetical protein